MNRNQMYDYLKNEVKMYAVFVRRENRKDGYHVEFRPNTDYNQHNRGGFLYSNLGIIEGFGSIHVHRDYFIVESKFGDMKVQMNYRDVEHFEVIFEEE